MQHASRIDANVYWISHVLRTSPRAGDRDAAELQEEKTDPDHMISGLIGGLGGPLSPSTLYHSNPVGLLPPPSLASQPSPDRKPAEGQTSGSCPLCRSIISIFSLVHFQAESSEACRSLDAGVGSFVASWMSCVGVILVGHLLLGRFPTGPCLHHVWMRHFHVKCKY